MAEKNQHLDQVVQSSEALFNEKTANFFNHNLPDSLEKLDFKNN